MRWSLEEGEQSPTPHHLTAALVGSQPRRGLGKAVRSRQQPHTDRAHICGLLHPLPAAFHHFLSTIKARPGQAGELGTEEPDEVQQRQMQGLAPGDEQPQAPGQAGAELLESSSAERDLVCSWTTE